MNLITGNFFTRYVAAEQRNNVNLLGDSDIKLVHLRVWSVMGKWGYILFLTSVHRFDWWISDSSTESDAGIINIVNPAQPLLGSSKGHANGKKGSRTAVLTSVYTSEHCGLKMNTSTTNCTVDMGCQGSEAM